MDFVKKHYEKIILGVVLVGLAAMVVFLFMWVSSEREKLSEQTTAKAGGKTTALPPLKEDELLKGLSPAPNLDFSMTNRLFNPVEWKRASDGKLLKIVRGDEVGPRALVVTNITPLYFTMTLDTIVQHETGASYGIGIQDESAPTVAGRRKKPPIFVTLGGKNPIFSLNEVKGTPEAPELTLLLADTEKTAVVSKEKPFQRVDAYMADLRYDPEKKVFPKLRDGSPFIIERAGHKISRIFETEVIVSADSNEKKYTIPYTGNR